MRHRMFISGIGVTAIVFATVAVWRNSNPTLPIGGAGSDTAPSPTISGSSPRLAPLTIHLEERVIPRGMSSSQANDVLNAKVIGHDEGTLDLLESIIHNHSDSDRLRNYAVQHVARWVEEVGEYRAVTILAQAAEPDSDSCIRDVAIFSLARLSDHVFERELLQGIRQSATHAIRLGLVDSTPPSPAVKLAAVRSAQFTGDLFVPELEAIAANREDLPAVRAAAFDVLGLLGDPGVIGIADRDAAFAQGLPAKSPLAIARNRARQRSLAAHTTASSASTIQRD